MGVTPTPNVLIPRGSAPWKGLPARMKVLYITTRERTGGWLADAFAADSASEVVLEEAVTAAAGLARLHDEVFDAVLVSHEPEELDALDLIEGYRAGSTEEPIVVLGNGSEQEMAPLCYEAGADGYVSVSTATTRNLIWVVARAVQRHELVRENRRFHETEQNRLRREHDEARRLLGQQRALAEPSEAGADGPGADLDRLPAGAPQPPVSLPPELPAHYRELLRIYVIMGSGNLAAELQRLADLLVATGLTAQQTLQLHLDVAEELVRGLGARSSRHVMTRADLLILEVMMCMAEGYRRLGEEQSCPRVQKLLPGL